MTTEEHRESPSSDVELLEGVAPHAHRPLFHLPVFERLKRRNLFRVRCCT